MKKKVFHRQNKDAIFYRTSVLSEQYVNQQYNIKIDTSKRKHGQKHKSGLAEISVWVMSCVLHRKGFESI